MIYLSLRKWSGRFHVPGVAGKIRRVIQAQLDLGECVLVLDDGAKGLSFESRRQIQENFPADKVRFSRIHPSIQSSNGQ
jgi:hypothetical protein